MSSHDAFAENVGVNTSEIFQGVWENIPHELFERIEFFLDLGSAALLAFIIYLAIVILIKVLSLFFGTKESRILKRISLQLDEILNLFKKSKHKKR